MQTLQKHMFTIEKNITIPDDGRKASRKRGRPAVFPLSDLKVGESFFVPLADWVARDSVHGNRPDALAISALQSTLHRAAANRHMRVVTRRMEEGGKLGVRVWRVRSKSKN